MIYEEVLRTPRADKAITPDPSYRRQQLGRRFTERTVKYNLAILRSYQQAHQEATASTSPTLATASKTQKLKLQIIVGII